MTSQSTQSQMSSKPTTGADMRREVYSDRTREGSALRTMLSEGSAVYAMLPAFVYLVLSEAGAKGVDDHDRVAKLDNRDSVTLEDVLGRLIDTLDLVVGLAFADDEERVAIAHAIFELHRHIEGTLEDGTRYHAWNKDLWSWSWAGILKPVMDSYGQLRGPVSAAFLQDGYVGWLQLGDLIGVKGLPETYPEFLQYWEQRWKTVAIDTGASRFIMSQIYAPLLPSFAHWLPRRLWNAMLWPVLNLLQVSTFVVMDPQIQQLLGMSPTRSQRCSIAVHRAFWRRVPHMVTKEWSGTYLRARLRHGNTSWNRHYSKESLAQYREQVRVARAAGDPEPPRPSVRR